MKTAYMAGTKYPNTPETDQQKYVWHEVTFDDGTTEDILATDPMDAIKKANLLHQRSAES